MLGNVTKGFLPTLVWSTSLLPFCSPATAPDASCTLMLPSTTRNLEYLMVQPSTMMVSPSTTGGISCSMYSSPQLVNATVPVPDDDELQAATMANKAGVTTRRRRFMNPTWYR